MLTIFDIQYESALNHNRASDPQILACLGRVWLLKGKQEKSPAAMKTSLSYSHRALSVAPQQIHFKFNIAFVQIQLAQLLYTLPEHQRTLEDVLKASEGLDEAIESFTEIAQSKNPPYPRGDIEQRANMGRNTMRRQLERAVQSQKEYEEKNAARLQEARDQREAETKRREDERRKAEELREEERRKIKEEREKMTALSRELAEKRAEEERKREEAEFTTDSEGERVKRKKAKKGGKRKKKGEESESETEGGDLEEGGKKKRRGGKKARSTEPSSAVGSSEDEGKKPRRRKRLARKADNYKSSEIVVDSDSSGEDAAPNGAATGEESDAEMRDPGEENTVVSKSRGRASRRIDDEDEDEEMEEDEVGPTTTAEKMAEELGDVKNGNSFADNPHGNPVDESVGAAGDRDTMDEGGLL